MGKHRSFIFEKMLRHGWIGDRHTHISNILKGKPRSEYEEIRKEVKTLMKEGYFIVKPDGLHISLDPRRLKEVIEQLNI